MDERLQMILLIIFSMPICIDDIKYRKIKNSQIYLLLIVCLYIMAVNGITYLPFIAALTVLILGFVISTLGYIGAGDVKLYATFLLVISPDYWSFSLITIIIIGGIQACCYLLYGVIINNLQAVRAKGIPYGVAISIASVFSIWISHF